MLSQITNGRDRVEFPEGSAAKDRWHAEKGLKDIVDIISFLKFANVKRDMLTQVLKEYDTEDTLRDTLKRAISESRIEYRFLGLTYEKDGAQLKKPYENL